MLPCRKEWVLLTGAFLPPTPAWLQGCYISDAQGRKRQDFCKGNKRARCGTGQQDSTDPTPLLLHPLQLEHRDRGNASLASDTKNLFTVGKPLPQGLLSPSSLRVMLSSFGEFVNRFL